MLEIVPRLQKRLKRLGIDHARCSFVPDEKHSRDSASRNKSVGTKMAEYCIFGRSWYQVTGIDSRRYMAHQLHLRAAPIHLES